MQRSADKIVAETGRSHRYTPIHNQQPRMEIEKSKIETLLEEHYDESTDQLAEEAEGGASKMLFRRQFAYLTVKADRGPAYGSI